MEILFLCHRIPYPPNKGDKIRAFHLLSHLAKKHHVHLGCMVDDPEDQKHAATLQRLVQGECVCVPLARTGGLARAAAALIGGHSLSAAYFQSPALRKWVDGLLARRRIDAVVLFGSAMAPLFLNRRGFASRNVVLDMVDVDSEKWREYSRASTGFKKWLYRKEADLLLKLEADAARSFGATVLASPHERQSFLQIVPDVARNTVSVANGVDLDYFAPEARHLSPFPAGEIPIVMTGAMDYRPNADGAVWFAQEVMPMILSRQPAARFYAVGSNPASRLRAIAGASCVVTGRVDDVRPYLSHAAAIVAPIHIARGVQNKVLEALAMRRPVVATEAATRALDVADGNQLRIANGPQAFCDAVLDILDGKDARPTAQRGRAYVEATHNWSRTLAAFDGLIEKPPSAVQSSSRGLQSAADRLDAGASAVAVGTR